MTGINTMTMKVPDGGGTEQVVADEQVPSFANSAMDGYALRAADTEGTPARLAIVGALMAGDGRRLEVVPGSAIRIMTGAPLPHGANAVCMVELTDTEGDVVVVHERLRPGTNVRQPGEDIERGDEVLASGTVVTPAHIGVLASLGLETVRVHPRPRVGVLTTGDELVSSRGPLAAGKIRDSNRHSILALVRQAGTHAVDFGIVGDREDAVSDVFERAADHCDILLTTGGVSVGDVDVVRIVLDKVCGGSMRWVQVAVKPAKPLAFGRVAGSGLPVVGLPGNPVSAMVSFELFGRPAIRQLAGHQVLQRAIFPARTQVDLRRRPDGKVHFVRASVTMTREGELLVGSSGGQASHQLLAMAEANCLVVLPDGNGACSGDRVDVMLLDSDGLGPVEERVGDLPPTDGTHGVG